LRWLGYTSRRHSFVIAVSRTANDPVPGKIWKAPVRLDVQACDGPAILHAFRDRVSDRSDSVILAYLRHPNSSSNC
jgi:hypothetical protein